MTKATCLSCLNWSVWAGLALSCATVSVSAQSYFLQPGPAATRDTWVNDQDDFDHGSWGVLQANQEQFNQRIFIQFDLSGIATPVTSAYLGLYRFEAFSGDTMTLNAYPVTQTWAENIGWSTMPTIDATAAASATVSGNAAGWVEWNITALVQAWQANPQANHGLAIFAPDGGDAGFQRFVSSDNATANQPIYSFPRETMYQPYIRGQLVPEPSSMSLLALGLTALIAARQRR